ncbi:adenylate/guanylate cyclase domain-containing protein [Nannocystis bainbridge]|uniref:Adenylate/guanylate cyclase domain-containing protein n=1 Tax=Nannocystis bainbridge TaxID=2995303 RepID=A0ABT5DU89_9BACT|nr:adenylate/guanylate cyclase domain-containing protein [Nannocystis bainbridge]MDC0717191.1 adenylate/guanylate cyclase domain-containing protein [Nannocystis bainbridge]
MDRGRMIHGDCDELVPARHHADRAMWCALHMQEALRRFNLRREGAGGPPLKIGVALHSGRVIVGDIGSPRRREYTAIGDVVNVASRLEALTKQLASPIVVSESTRSRIRGPVRFVQAPKQPIRGRSGRIAVFLPEFDASVGVREGIWLRDHESIPELADAADSAGIDETLQSLAPAESSPWLAKKEVAAVGSS